MSHKEMPIVFILLGLSPFICLCGSAQSIENQSGFNIDVRADLVELFLNVRDREGAFIKGLKQEHFSVYDDGEARELAFIESEQHPITVVMLLDTSGSMAGSMLYLQIAASSFLANLREKDRVALYSFGRSMKEIAPFTRDKLAVMAQIDSLYPEGGTPLYDALVRGMKMLTEVPGRKALLLFTDGADSTSRLSYECAVRRCGRSSIPLFAVGCGKAVKDWGLRKRLDVLSKNSGGKAIYVEDTQDLTRAFTQLSDVLRTTYHAGYYSERKPDGKWHDVSVELKSGRYSIQTRRGYFAMK